MKRYYYEKYRQNVTEYKCKNRIYYYCSKPFIYFNKTYPSGYYDDRDKYYYNVAFTNGKSHIKCNHCGKKFQLYLNENDQIKCPMCYSNIKISKIDTLKKKNSMLDNYTTNLFMVGACLFVAIFLLIATLVYVNVIAPRQNEPGQITTKVEAPTVKYFSELDRECKITGYNSYYDAKTNCYFKYDTERHPAQWMYYFIGISDQYPKDYGWMVYNKNLDVWQINVGLKEWVNLKNNELWHFTNAYSYEQDTIDSEAKN